MIAAAAVLLAGLAAAPLAVGSYHRALILAILADVALAVAWASFSGPTRYLSLATGAFFGAGAYATAMLVGRLAWPLPVVAGAAVAATMALAVGALALRLRGPYFAVFTFGLAELAKHTLIWFETGITGTVGRLILTPPGPNAIYYTVLALAALAVGGIVIATPFIPIVEDGFAFALALAAWFYPELRRGLVTFRYGRLLNRLVSEADAYQRKQLRYLTAGELEEELVEGSRPL